MVQESKQVVQYAESNDSSAPSLDVLLRAQASSRRIKEQFTGEVGARSKEIDYNEGHADRARTATWLTVSQSDIFQALDAQKKAIMQQVLSAGHSQKAVGSAAMSPQSAAQFHKQRQQQQDQGQHKAAPYEHRPPSPTRRHIGPGQVHSNSGAGDRQHPPQPEVPSVAPGMSDTQHESGNQQQVPDADSRDLVGSSSRKYLARHGLARDVVDWSLEKHHEPPYSVHRMWNPSTNMIQATAKPSDYFLGPEEAHRRELESLNSSQRHVKHARQLLHSQAAAVARQQEQELLANSNPYFNTPYHAHPSSLVDSHRPTPCHPYQPKWGSTATSNSFRQSSIGLASLRSSMNSTTSAAFIFPTSNDTDTHRRLFSAPPVTPHNGPMPASAQTKNTPKTSVQYPYASITPGSPRAAHTRGPFASLRLSPTQGHASSAHPQTKHRPFSAQPLSSTHPSYQPSSAHPHSLSFPTHPEHQPPSSPLVAEGSLSASSPASIQRPPRLQVGIEQEDNNCQALQQQQQPQGVAVNGRPGGRGGGCPDFFNPELLARAISPIKEEGQEELQVAGEPSNCAFPELNRTTEHSFQVQGLSSAYQASSPHPAHGADGPQSCTPAHSPAALGPSRLAPHSGYTDSPSTQHLASMSEVGQLGESQGLDSPMQAPGGSSALGMRPGAVSPLSPASAAMLERAFSPHPRPCPSTNPSSTGASNTAGASPRLFTPHLARPLSPNSNPSTGAPGLPPPPLPLPLHLAQPMSPQLQLQHYQQQLQQQQDQQQEHEGTSPNNHPASTSAKDGSISPPPRTAKPDNATPPAHSVAGPVSGPEQHVGRNVALPAGLASDETRPLSTSRVAAAAKSRPSSAQPRFSPTPSGAQPFQPRLHSLLRRSSSSSRPSSASSRPTSASQHVLHFSAAPPTAAAASNTAHQELSSPQHLMHDHSKGDWGAVQQCSWQEVGGALDTGTSSPTLRTTNRPASAHIVGASKGVRWGTQLQTVSGSPPVSHRAHSYSGSSGAVQGGGGSTHSVVGSTHSGRGGVGVQEGVLSSMVGPTGGPSTLQTSLRRVQSARAPSRMPATVAAHTARLPMSAKARRAAQEAEEQRRAQQEVEALGCVTVTMPASAGSRPGGAQEADNDDFNEGGVVQIKPMGHMNLVQGMLNR